MANLTANKESQLSSEFSKLLIIKGVGPDPKDLQKGIVEISEKLNIPKKDVKSFVNQIYRDAACKGVKTFKKKHRA